MNCPYCADARVEHIGALGSRHHYRCKACGGQFSRSARHTKFPRKGGGTYTALDPTLQAREEHIRSRITEDKR